MRRPWQRRASSPPAATSRPPTSRREHATVVALLRLASTGGGHPSPAELLTTTRDPRDALQAALDDDRAQTTLLPGDPRPLVAAAAADVERWAANGINLVSVLDPDYPLNLHAVHDRPALLLVRGRLIVDDEHSVAIIGSRHPSPAGVVAARRLANELRESGHAIVSGLASGIDAAAHTATLEADGRTLAVLGTGVDRVYPAEHAALQRTIAERGAVISCFWPDQPPTKQTFPVRNGLMSGLTRGTVIVEASPRSGTRIQARRALAHGRPVFLHPVLLAQRWAQELAERPNVYVTGDAGQIVAAIERQQPRDPLTSGPSKGS